MPKRRNEDPAPDESPAAALRRMYSYKRMILRGRIRLPHRSARRLIGPDCAYHLYHRHKASDNESNAGND
jgi:hypothetical protein